MNKSIIVVEAISTGQFFIEDIRELGYTPVILETLYNGEYILPYRKSAYKYLDNDLPLIIKEDEIFEKTIEKIKDLNPILIIPGADEGIELACKISKELGLMANDLHAVDCASNKDKMQKCLKKSGLRHIESKVVDNFNDALDFYRNKKPVYIKPSKSAGSVNAFLATSELELESCFNKIVEFNDGKNITNNEVVVQEYIKGNEYIVNTVVNQGKSKIVSAWEYNKHQINGGANVLDCMKSIMPWELTPQIKQLFQYAIDVNAALGITYGGVHAEFKIDDNGPVLIETNCRPQGSSRPPVFTNKVFGHHETDMILKSYLNPEYINFDDPLNYDANYYGIVKYLISPYDAVTTHTPILNILKTLPSYICCAHINEGEKKHIKKTTALDTSPGTIFLAHKDIDTLLDDYKKLVNLETYNFDKLFC